MQQERRVQIGERLFWIVAAVLALIFLAYFIDAYRFGAPARQHIRHQLFGRGIF